MIHNNTALSYPLSMKQIPDEKASAAQRKEASSKTTLQKRLRELALTSQSLALLVAKNPKTSAPLLAKLATTSSWKYEFSSYTPPLGYSPWSEPNDYDWLVEEATRREIARHPNTSLDTLLKLACLCPEEVSTHPTFLASVSKSAKRLAKLPPLHFLTLFSKKPFASWVKEATEALGIRKAQLIAREPRAPEIVLRHLAPRRDAKVLELLGKHHRTPKDIVVTLSALPDFQRGAAYSKR
jgi:hypothetical protein